MHRGGQCGPRAVRSGDLDQDGNTSERLPIDFDGYNRVRGVVVDKGAFEFQPPCGLTADLDGDADVDISDLARLANYGTPSGKVGMMATSTATAMLTSAT